jgi:hypothetical protein
MGRCFAISADGERMGSHVTDVMATCRDGSVGAPMVIKTRGGGDKPQEASRKRRLGEHVQVPGVKLTDKEGLVDDDATDGVKLRLTVKTSNSGSMTIELFIDWCDHFIENTLKPRGLGPGARAPSPCSSLLSSRRTPFHCFPLGTRPFIAFLWALASACRLATIGLASSLHCLHVRRHLLPPCRTSSHAPRTLLGRRCHPRPLLRPLWTRATLVL